MPLTCWGPCRARRCARSSSRAGLAIPDVAGTYLHIPFPGGLDAVFMIYGDLSVLPSQQRVLRHWGTRRLWRQHSAADAPPRCALTWHCTVASALTANGIPGCCGAIVSGGGSRRKRWPNRRGGPARPHDQHQRARVSVAGSPPCIPRHALCISHHDPYRGAVGPVPLAFTGTGPTAPPLPYLPRAASRELP